MSNAQTRGWGDPDAPSFRKNNIVKISGGGVSLWVHKEVAPVFEHFLDTLSKHYPLTEYTAGDDWGYANRDVRGRPGVKSNHAWGLAVDLNATENPMTSNLSARYQFKRDVVFPLLARYRGKLIWGGDYKGERKDYMHFEFVGTPADARAVCKTLTIPTPVVITPTPKSEEDDMKFKAVRRNTDGAIGLLGNGKFKHVDQETLDVVKNNNLLLPGQPEELNEREWDVLLALHE